MPSPSIATNAVALAAVLTVTLLAAAPAVVAYGPPPTPSPPRGLWVWGGHASPLVNGTTQKDFFAFVAQQSEGAPISTVLVEDEGLSKGDAASAAAFEKVMKTAAAAGISVAALYGWKPAVDSPFPATGALAFVDAVLALAAGGGAAGLAGVSFDMEPNSTSPRSYQQYADLLQKVRTQPTCSGNACLVLRLGS
jgi:hypothetical protein